MPGPLPKDPGTRARRNKSATKATLQPVEDPYIPDLPDPEDYIPFALDTPAVDDDLRPVWSKAVKNWWTDIWSSPMSAEFHPSDIHGLYLAAVYLQQALNPLLKAADRLAFAKQHEACVKNFGLSPMSRRALQWEIAKVDEAHQRAARRKPAEPTEKKGPRRVDPRGVEDVEKPNPFKSA